VNDNLLRACRNEPVDHVPVWFMRQAGRSLPEYRKLRSSHSILEMCRDPALAAEATLQPVRRLGVDAAILFSDIVVPLEGMGVELDIQPGVGPVIEKPIRTLADVERLRELDPESDVPYVLETIRTLRRELDVPLIGFGGAPFTLASYLVQGGPSRDHARTKALMHGAPDAWHLLMDRLSASMTAYLRAQTLAGAQVIQLFDSWVGHLDPSSYQKYVLPSVLRIFAGLSGIGTPTIYFGVMTGELLPLMASAMPDVVGVDWRVPLDVAKQRVGKRPVQGNLDPSLLFAPWDVVEAATLDVLKRGGGRGHIFNLGHGVLPDTDPDVLARVVETVHGWSPDD
jgi:uroporphyrinogen decarboxylase